MYNQNFKVGDKVIRLNNNSKDFPTGYIGVITDIIIDIYGNATGCYLDNIKLWHDFSNLKLVEKDKKVLVLW